MSNSVDFSSLVVRSSDNSVDVDATETRVLNALGNWLTANGKLSEEIGAAVMSAFEVAPKSNSLFIVNHALRVLNPSPENFGVVQKKIVEYVKANAGPHDDLNAVFAVQSGRNGGTQLWTTELRAEAAKSEAERDAKEAKKASKSK